ncbi:MAG: hypothetical protein U0235_19825 [Polyangiaceae bacterium]
MRGLAPLAALVPAFRPEMAAWAFVLASGASPSIDRREIRARSSAQSRSARSRSCRGPRRSCSARSSSARPCRFLLLAKPSDLAHGLSQRVAAAGLAALGPVFAFACSPPRGPAVRARCLASGAAHLVAVALAGGDWMPHARLVAPIVPSLALGAVLVDARASALGRALRAPGALGLGAWLFGTEAPAGRRVVDERRVLAESARPLLASSRRVATVDIGWPSSVSEAAIVDLAGLTDPVVARLPGGHTSKRVDPALLLDRDPDALLFFARGTSPADAVYLHMVEARLAASDVIRSHYAPQAFVALGGGTGYVVWKRTDR